MVDKISFNGGEQFNEKPIIEKEKYGEKGVLQTTSVFNAEKNEYTITKEYDFDGDGIFDAKIVTIENKENGILFTATDKENDGKYDRFTESSTEKLEIYVYKDTDRDGYLEHTRTKTDEKNTRFIDNNADGIVDSVEITTRYEKEGSDLYDVKELTPEEYKKKTGKDPQISRDVSEFKKNE